MRVYSRKTVSMSLVWRKGVGYYHLILQYLCSVEVVLEIQCAQTITRQHSMGVDNDNDNDKVFYSTLIIQFIIQLLMLLHIK